MISIQTVTDNILAEFAGGIAEADGLAADKPPSMINLADCFNAGHCPPNDLAEAETRLRDLALLRGEWHLPGLPLRTKRFAPDGALILEVGQLFEQISDPPPDELAQYATPQDGDRVYGERQVGVGVAPLTASSVGIYEHWEDTASNARPGFPLTPNPPMGGVNAGQIGMREPAREKAWAPLDRCDPARVFSSRTGPGERSMEAGNRVIVRSDAAGCTRGRGGREFGGVGAVADSAVRLGVGWLAVGPGRC